MKYAIKITISSTHDLQWVKNYIYNKLSSGMIFVRDIETLNITENLDKFKNRKYPFRFMDIGEKYVFPLKYSRDNMRLASNAARNFARYSKDCKHYKFSVRKEDELMIITRMK